VATEIYWGVVLVSESVSGEAAWTHLAQAALAYAQGRRVDKAEDAVTLLADRYGADCLPSVVVSWIDAMIEACEIPRGPDVALHLRWAHGDGRDPEVTSEAETVLAWMGALVAAVAAEDDRLQRVLLAAPGDPLPMPYVLVAVKAAAVTIHHGGDVRRLS
jgi:hypothetical protein